jgi:hypothetical protein
MSHWAELDENNVVTRVLVGDNNDPAGDEGYQWLIDNLGGTWVKTSYNAVEGNRRDPETGEITEGAGFRKNYAGIGYTYDSVIDAFIPPKFFASWTLDEETCMWNAPTPMPVVDGKIFEWIEADLNWQEVIIPGE